MEALLLIGARDVDGSAAGLELDGATRDVDRLLNLVEVPAVLAADVVRSAEHAELGGRLRIAFDDLIHRVDLTVEVAEVDLGAGGRELGLRPRLSAERRRSRRRDRLRCGARRGARCGLRCLLVFVATGEHQHHNEAAIQTFHAVHGSDLTKENRRRGLSLLQGGEHSRRRLYYELRISSAMPCTATPGSTASSPD
jgi:hypothetical protein